MRELGQILRSKRESLGFDLDQIEVKTKIRKRYLLALEDGDWSVLPGRVYARGFVRSYADALGLDGLDLLQNYVDGKDVDSEASKGASGVQNVSEQTKSQGPQTGEEVEVHDKNDSNRVSPEPAQKKIVAKMENGRPSSTSQPVRTSASMSRQRDGFRGRGALIQTSVIVATLVIVAGGWWILHGKMSRTSANTSPSAGLTNNTLNTATSSNATQAAGGTSGPANNTANQVSTQPPTPPVKITEQPISGGIRTYLVQNASKLDTELQVASGQCWISVTVDGKVVDGNDTVNQGQNRTFNGTNTVLLRLGHVQGVQLTVDGQVVQLPNTQSAVNILLKRQ